MNGYEDQPATQPNIVTAAPKPKRRRCTVALITTLVTLGALGAGGVAYGLSHRSTAYVLGRASVLDQPRSGPTGGAPQPNGSNGWPFAGPGGSGTHRHAAPGTNSPQSGTTGKATTRQQVGVVDINTVLRYEGARAAGTGMILTSDGEILTNNHVVEGATSIKVTVVSTGQTYRATVVGTDKLDDVAVLQLSGVSGLSTVTPDITSAVQVGDAITAVGNAGGAGGIPSAVSGTVTDRRTAITTNSELNVDGERLRGLIEVDADIRSGDSGGPLYDAQGEVIGMTAAASTGRANISGYAIPITKVLRIASSIESGVETSRITIGYPAFLGVQLQRNTGTLGTSGGAPVAGVLAGTPAARIGMSSGDAIIKLDGKPVASAEALTRLVQSYQPGASVTVTWVDGIGSSHTATVVLIEGPPV